MSDIAIRCEGLSKRYRIGERESYKALRDVIADAAASPFRRLRSALHNGSATSNGSHSVLTRHSSLRTNDSPLITHHSSLGAPTRNSKLETQNSFWALDNVAFEVRRGEVVGIIGRNGAGKSTLLKILSRITKPTKGHAEVHGRVGSLLEVGTGFHPELTGRENIYLNAAILGMRKGEVERKFDEIVAFAEVERFIDTPVKRYSSGMYVRLAFAVAAHLDPEILIIDEVLAVGDASFQKKCLGKIGEVARGGRTVLFVSHNMGAVRMLCDEGVWLDEGKVACKDSIHACTQKYESSNSSMGSKTWQAASVDTSKDLVIKRVEVDVQRKATLTLNVQVDLVSRRPHKPAFVAFDILDPSGTAIMQALPQLKGFIDSSHEQHHLEVTINLPPVVPSQYSLSVWVGSHNTETLDEVKGCVSFEITESPTPGRTFPHHPGHGFIVPEATVNYRTA